MLKKGLLFIAGLFAILFGAAQKKDQQVHEEPINYKQHLVTLHKVQDKEEADSFHILHLMLAGNIYQTEKHVNYAYDQASGKYDFKNEFNYVQPILNLGDVSIANLKTSFGDNVNDMFSSPDEFALAVKYSGINTIMHANLHTANISKVNLQRTRDLLNDFDMFHTGAFTDMVERLGNYPLIVNKKGFKIAILNYTSLPSRPTASRPFVINELDKFYIDRDMRMALANKPDFIIVYFDWNDNEQAAPTHQQQELAQYVFEKGADLVIGTAPNVPMKIDFLNYFYDGKPREGMVAYSLGNLMASNEQLRNRNGYIIDMELRKNMFTRETKISDWGVIPVYTYYDTTSTPGKTKVFSLPCWAIESGDVFPNIPYIEKRRVVNSAYEIRKMLGSIADEIQYNLNEHIVNNVTESIKITSASLNNKYSQKREWDIKPTAAPVLPVAGSGSGDAPSLAMMNEEIIKAKTQVTGGAKRPETPYEAAKKASYDIFNPPAEDTAAAPKSNTTTSNAPIAAIVPSSSLSTSAIGDASPKGLSEANGNNTGSNQNSPAAATGSTAEVKPSADNSAASVGTAVKTSSAPVSVSPEINSDSKSVASAAQANSSPASNETSAKSPATSAPINDTKKVSTAGNSSNDNSKAAAASASATSDDAKKRTTSNSVVQDDSKIKSSSTSIAEDDARKGKSNTPAFGDDGKNGTAANTNYHTTGNDYQLKEQPSIPREKNASAPVQAERPKEQGFEMNAKETEDISTKVKSDLKADIKTVKGPEVKTVIDTFYRIQFYALKKYLPLDTNYYTHLKGYEVFEENGMFKYVLGKYSTYVECYKYWKSQILPRYKESFIVKYINGRRVVE